MATTRLRRGVYPGTFNPPTIAHLAIARAALEQRHLDVVVLTVSRSPIDKEHVERPTLEHRLAVLHDEASRHDWLAVELTERRLLADIAQGFDVLIMGADKWAQVNDARYYASDAACDAAVASLPELAIAPRPPAAVPAQHALDLAIRLAEVSSSDVRAGAHHWMSPAAAAFDDATGAWSDPARYERWLTA